MKLIAAILLLVAGIMAGCGMGGGVAETPKPTLTIATRAPLASTVLYGVSLTVRLPAGVTVAADASGEVAPLALTPKVEGSQVMGTYVPAATSSPATVTIIVVNPNGFTVGDLVNVACLVGPGVSPTGASFSVTDFTAWTVQGKDIVTIDGISPELSYALIP